MAINPPKSQVQQGREESREILSLNDSAASKISNNLVSAMDAGYGSTYLRDQADHILHEIAQAGAIDYQWTVMRQQLSFTEKIAYLVGSTYAHAAEMGLVA